MFEKSFASHEKSINPRTLFKNTKDKFWFKCNKCNHMFETRLNSINQFNKWCGYCSNPPKIVFDNHLPLMKNLYIGILKKITELIREIFLKVLEINTGLIVINAVNHSKHK